MYDVAIIGGGVIGCCIARELSKYQVKVILLEQKAEVGFGTSKSNSGIIHPGHHSSPATLKGQLVVKGNSMFDRLAAELKFGFRRIGEIVVAIKEEDLKTLEELKEQGEQKGVKGLTIWSQSELRKAEPNLSRKLLGALYAPSAGVINPYEFAFSLIENAKANGVELKVNSPVKNIVPEKEGFSIDNGQTKIKTRFILNAAGVFADQVAALLSLSDFSIHPRKGEEYMLDKRLMGLVQRLVFPVPQKTTKGTLIIPTFDGTIMVGPTAVDTDNRFDDTTTHQGSEEVFKFVKSLCPAISEKDTITEFAGLRAVSNTNDFIIGPTKVKGFINVAGIQSPGLTASPAIAEYVCDMLKKEGLELIAKESFNPEVSPPPRFANLSVEKQQELVSQNPAFGKVVCRCELVTEAEIHNAIDHGAQTLDGIKFRNRAGMGRCQGGFCTSRCMDILSERLKLPFEKITKRGGNSWIVTEMTNEQHPEGTKEEEV